MVSSSTTSFQSLSPPGSNHSANGYNNNIPIRKSRLRRVPSQRRMPIHIFPLPKQWSTIVGSLVCCLLFVTILPIYVLVSVQDPEHHPRAAHGVHQLLNVAQALERDVEDEVESLLGIADHVHDKDHKDRREEESVFLEGDGAAASEQQQQEEVHPHVVDKEKINNNPQHRLPAKSENANQQQHAIRNPSEKNQRQSKKSAGPKSIVEQQAKPQYTLQDLQELDKDPNFNVDWQKRPVARGLSGRDFSLTPSVKGAQRAHISNCEINVDSLVYWNDPVGDADRTFVSPFTNRKDPTKEQFITFSPDRGGWNNVRMSMEILFVLAAVTGRTLVLPPKEPLYLLNKDKGQKFRGFVDFFPLSDNDRPESFPVKLMSMEEFLQTPQQQELLSQPLYQANRTKILLAAPFCDKRHVARDRPCDPLYDYLTQVGYNPEFSARETCLLFDRDAVQNDDGQPSEEARQVQAKYCGSRKPVYWTYDTFMKYDHLHLPAHHKDFRLLSHFYNFFFFSDPLHANHYKRFVRDYLHYNDVIYCAAAKVVRAVQKEAVERGFALDEEGGGGYSSLHIRRGDLQYKKVKIPAQEWYDNTKEVWRDKELLYVATDERNKTFFDDLARHYELRFLDDYWDLAGLSGLDPNYMGMIDTIVASRGRAFAGTWFSTFTGYINRMRGYHGMSMQDSWYSFLPKKNAVHTWDIITHYTFAFEWPDGWVGIDADEWPERDKF